MGEKTNKNIPKINSPAKSTEMIALSGMGRNYVQLTTVLWFRDFRHNCKSTETCRSSTWLGESETINLCLLTRKLIYTHVISKQLTYRTSTHKKVSKLPIIQPILCLWSITFNDYSQAAIQWIKLNTSRTIYNLLLS